MRKSADKPVVLLFECASQLVGRTLPAVVGDNAVVVLYDVNAAALAAPNGLYDEGTLTPQERKHVIHAVEVTGTHARYAAALFDGIQLRRGAVVPHQLRKNDLVVEQTVVRLVYLTGADPVKLGEILLFVVVLKVVKGDLIHHVPAEDRIPYAKVQRDAEVVRCEQYPYYPACCRQQPAEK